MRANIVDEPTRLRAESVVETILVEERASGLTAIAENLLAQKKSVVPTVSTHVEPDPIEALDKENAKPDEIRSVAAITTWWGVWKYQSVAGEAFSIKR